MESLRTRHDVDTYPLGLSSASGNEKSILFLIWRENINSFSERFHPVKMACFYYDEGMHVELDPWLYKVCFIKIKEFFLHSKTNSFFIQFIHT